MRRGNNCKIKNWQKRSQNRADWERYIKEAKVHTGPKCHLRRRGGGRRRRILLSTNKFGNDWERYIREEKFHTGPKCHLRRRGGGRRRILLSTNKFGNDWERYTAFGMWWHTVTHVRGSEGETGEWRG